ncbi:MAG: radical SAM protein, partial [Acidobacteriota bacterium]|nr:radical SAM protein [Acidobacteriota bacterium]
MNKSRPSSIYGPVDSWRLGKSLGVDVLCVDSICSFECVYCQLGKINRVTLDRDIFVTTEEILEDLAETNWKDADVITFSGSGEPTLAANLGDVISKLKTKTGKPIVILTNSTLLNLPEVRSELSMADKVFCKLDAWSDDVLRRVDRPHVGIDLESIVEGICLLRDEVDGFLAIQTMLLRAPCESDIQAFADLLNRIGPDEIQLNTPTRPIPPEYFPETRGNEVEYDQGFTQLKTISKRSL